MQVGLFDGSVVAVVLGDLDEQWLYWAGWIETAFPRIGLAELLMYLDEFFDRFQSEAVSLVVPSPGLVDALHVDVGVERKAAALSHGKKADTVNDNRAGSRADGRGKLLATNVLGVAIHVPNKVLVEFKMLRL